MIARYRNDAERKRLEYLLDKYAGRLRLRRPSGTVVLVEGSEPIIEDLLRELYSRLDPEIIEVYEARPPKKLPEPTVEKLELQTSMPCQETLGAIGFLMAKLRGVLRYDLSGTREYVVRSRSGIVRVRVQAPPSLGGPCRIALEVEGYGDVVDRLSNALERELSLLGEVRRP